MPEDKMEGQPTNEEKKLDGGTSAEEKGKDQPIDYDKAIQSATDKVRTEYSKQLKEATEKLRKLETEKMTEDEKARYEREQKEKDISIREQQAIRRENIALAGELLLDSEIDPKSFKEILAGSSEDETKKNVENFVKIWKSELKKSVENSLAKITGRVNPASSTDTNVSKADIDTQIREAESKGNFMESIRLKEMKRKEMINANK